MTLREFFQEHNRAALAFSGGTDSALLLWAAAQYGAQVRALLKRYGAAQLSAVKAEDYESLLLAAQAIGNEVGADE